MCQARHVEQGWIPLALTFARYRQRIDRATMAQLTAEGQTVYGSALMTSYEAKVSGDLAEVTYGTDPAVDEVEQPWARTMAGGSGTPADP